MYIFYFLIKKKILAYCEIVSFKNSFTKTKNKYIEFSNIFKNFQMLQMFNAFNGITMLIITFKLFIKCDFFLIYYFKK